MHDTSVIRVNVILIANLLVMQTRTGAELNAFQKDGFVMVRILVLSHFKKTKIKLILKATQIVLMEPMRMLRCTHVLHQSHVKQISLDAKTIDA